MMEDQERQHHPTIINMVSNKANWACRIFLTREPPLWYCDCAGHRCRRVWRKAWTRIPIESRISSELAAGWHGVPSDLNWAYSTHLLKWEGWETTEKTLSLMPGACPSRRESIIIELFRLRWLGWLGVGARWGQVHGVRFLFREWAGWAAARQ